MTQSVYSCKDGDTRKQITYVLVNGAYVPAPTVCANPALISSSSINSNPDALQSVDWLQLTSDGSLFTGNRVGIGGSPVEPTAALQIVAKDKGLLIPSLTSTQRNAIEDPANGLMIYNTTTNRFNYFNGTEWAEIGEGASGGGGELELENPIWELSLSSTSSAATNKFQMTGLVGDTDRQYMIVFRINCKKPNPSDTMTYGFTLNNDIAANKYSSNFIVSDATSVDNAVNEMNTQIKLEETSVEGTVISGVIYITHADSTIYRHMKIEVSIMEPDGSIRKTIMGSGVWRNNSSNLITFELVSNLIAIDVQSKIEVWVKKKLV